MNLFSDEYKTIKEPVTGVFREKGSKFIAYAFETVTENEFKSHLEEIKKEHFKARHHCYAYILGTEGVNYRYNDDGEPSGTAGLPIYNQIRSHELSNIGIIVVRYFGGTKLGVPGLINAYKSAAKVALDSADIVVRYSEKTIEIHYPYERTGDIMKVVNAGNYQIVANLYNPSPSLITRVRESKTDELKKQILAALLKRELYEINGDEIVEGVKFNIDD
jgi:uncharacterized YigZ family protein